MVAVRSHEQESLMMENEHLTFVWKQTNGIFSLQFQYSRFLSWFTILLSIRIDLILSNSYKLLLSHILRTFLSQIRDGGRKKRGGGTTKLLCMERQLGAALQYS